ncbi:type IV pili methyl-accepting chemotaxis transducer N-terminal domain-containing protein [Ramlibacter sp.]|uniref:type IV pili methyl-accepting chemotaxis transducer N-terminal domain-containing protein n=1 Tax=Ramlibacter sp. TaxID=1917967 RepID=UPI002D3C98F4|nr:type IV pili methyl-accepting chemotaxis transducer N-terminal domain-containing protein [Ramlibacter sp.]HYD76981.1 type IV pili methyl-accepting chemotaxis transducer N-terminal domain-containing protein [Ramlibacter sp.]
MKGAWTLTSKLVVTGITFLVVALASTGLTLWVSWHLEGGAAAVNEAGRLRMLTYRLASTVEHGDREGARRIVHTFDGILDLLGEGDPGRPLFVPWSRASSGSFQAIRTHWALLRTGWLEPSAPATGQLQADADAFVGEVDAFVAAIEQELARWTSVLHGFQFLMMMLALATTIVLLYTAHLLVLDPLIRLRTAVASLRDGDLGARLEVDRRDEFGELAEGFNDMAGHLQALYDSLEQRVREKTATLEAQRRRLADLYEVSAFAARATQIDELAQGFARRMRRITGAQAAAVRWSDEGNSRYVLLASDNLPADMAREEACVETGSCLCGQPRQDASARIIPIHPGPSAPLGHCARHGYSGLVSVPIRLHDQALGEIDLFFTETPDPAGTDRELLEALAGHLAGAMEGLRAGALEREAAVAQERTLLASELHDSIAQSLAFLKIQVQLLRSALQQGDRAALERVAGELDTGVRETYSDVRELLMHFRTRTSSEDIAPALETTLAKFEHQTGLRTQLRVDGRGVALPPDVQVQVLHIVQEALSNVRKHAGAREVQVEVTSSPHWRFEVRDDGRGFAAAEARPDETHVGLRIMKERAQRIGAEVRVHSHPGHGCSVVLELRPGGTAGAVDRHEEATA